MKKYPAWVVAVLGITSAIFVAAIYGVYAAIVFILDLEAGK